MAERNRFDEIDREQLAAQLVAIMNAHFQRPTIAERQNILHRAARQLVCIEQAVLNEVSDGAETVG